MTTRHPPPKHYTDWLDIATKTPHLCHNCDHYDTKGVCTKFDMTPPEDFAATNGACEEWVIEIGF